MVFEVCFGAFCSARFLRYKLCRENLGGKVYIVSKKTCKIICAKLIIRAKAVFYKIFIPFSDSFKVFFANEASPSASAIAANNIITFPHSSTGILCSFCITILVRLIPQSWGVLSYIVRSKIEEPIFRSDIFHYWAKIPLSNLVL